MNIRGYAAGDALLRSGPYTVYRGRRVRDQRAVLLKTVTDGSSSRGAGETLAREADLLRELVLPGVARVLDWIPADDQGQAGCIVLDDRGFECPRFEHPLAAGRSRPRPQPGFVGLFDTVPSPPSRLDLRRPVTSLNSCQQRRQCRRTD